jgi:hypothetical protein
MDQTEKSETPDEMLEEFGRFVEYMLGLMQDYQSGKVTRDECIEKLLPIMEASDFKNNPYYSSAMH